MVKNISDIQVIDCEEKHGGRDKTTSQWALFVTLVFFHLMYRRCYYIGVVHQLRYVFYTTFRPPLAGV